MKNFYPISAFLPAFFLSSLSFSQSNFTPEAYLQFRQEHSNYETEALLEDYPPRTTYYSQRQFPAGLDDIPWFDTLDNLFRFTTHEKKLLEQNHFMVTERLGSMDWAGALIHLYSNDLPLFLSSDLILTSLHISYDAILQTIEWQFLEPNLLELLHALYDRFPVVAADYEKDGRFEETVRDVDLYISVALSLAEDRKFIPRFETEAKFSEVMDAIAAEQFVEMELFTSGRNRKLDFSQFTPRGHYNKEIYTPDGTITLEKYFRAMMWLGRIDFLLTAPPGNPWEPEWSEDELRRMQLGALMLNEVLYGCGELDNLQKHEEIISFMVGPDDNLTPAELRELSEESLSGAAGLFDGATFDLFMEKLNASDDYGQKIMSNFFYVDPMTDDPGNLPVSYKLLGQKFLIDSYVFSEVVFDRIIHQGQKVWRPMPDPLDAMAALGNEDALALLEHEMDSFKYAANMAGLRYLVDSYDDGFWEQSLYNTWLGAIRSLNPPSSTAGMPYFMQTTAWHHEKLNTQLASWAQLRHDNILYGKQSYTGGTACSYPVTYVEPYPDLYRRLKVFAQNASGFFADVFSGEMVPVKTEITGYYTRYGEIMEILEEIAIKELQQIPLSETEVTFLKTMINSFMASGPSVTGWYTDLFFDVWKGLGLDFTVADVHTQPTEYMGPVVGKVLHVGNGMINTGVFLADNPSNPGQLMAFAGPVSSFHTEITRDFKRLTDQEWEEKFWTGPEFYPSRPDWVWNYLADQQGNAYPQARALKGEIYTGTGIGPVLEQQPLDYLLLFPNPASGEARLRFLLNRAGDLDLEVYDAAGRKIYSERWPGLKPAEHDISLPVDTWPQGLYLVRAGIAGTVMVRELVVQ